jgi:hypothetical protein
LRSSSADGRVAGFLSKSCEIRFLIRGGILEGIFTGFESVISFNFDIGCYFVVI